MNPSTYLVVTAITLILGGACLFSYRMVAPTIPRADRLRLLMFVMSLPIVVLAMIATTNPLPAAIALVQMVWRHGPSG